MSLHFSKPTTLVAAGVLALGAVFSHRAEAGAGLRFCVDSASPLADNAEQLAHAAAEAQGYEAVIHRFNGHGHGDDPFELDRFKMMVPADCDLVLGYPADPATPNIPEGLMATPAYAHTGFVLVGPDTLPESLKDFPDGTVVGVQWSTLPNLYVQRYANLTADVHSPYRGGTLASLAAGKDDVAMVWQPSLVAYAKQHPEAVDWSSRILDEPHARWDVVALYGPDTTTAARQFEQGLAKLADQGKLASLLAPLAAAKIDPDALSDTGDAAASNATSGDASDKSGDESAASPDNTSTDSSGEDSHDADADADADDQASSEEGGPQNDKAGSGPWSHKLYTKAQASQGHGVYARYCAGCHGAQLEGHTGPSLKGGGFATKAMGFTVSAMFDFMASQMPAGGAEQLSKKQYAQVMAFMLSENGYAAGDDALTYEEAASSDLPLISKPDS